MQTCQVRKTIRKIELICANFLWQGKHYKISWANICKPKGQGGLGLKKLEELEEAYAIKLSWVYFSKTLLGKVAA